MDRIPVLTSSVQFTTDAARARAIKWYGAGMTGFCYCLMMLAMCNSLARADLTFAVAALSAISVVLSNRSLAFLALFSIVFSLVVDIAWVSVHGGYLAE